MSKNKFWNNKTEVNKVVLNDANFETVKEVVSVSSTFSEKEKLMIEDTEVKDTLENRLEETIETLSIQVIDEFKNGEIHAIEVVLDLLCNYKKGMHDDTYAIDTRLVADWLKLKLKQKGFEV